MIKRGELPLALMVLIHVGGHHKVTLFKISEFESFNSSNSK